MKRLSILSAAGRIRCGELAIALAMLVGCADPLERRSTEEVGSQLQRGISGQGQIGPEQREPGDPAAEHGVPQTHP